jgi:hypothetical protein
MCAQQSHKPEAKPLDKQQLISSRSHHLQEAAAAPAHGAYTFSERTTTVSTLPVLMRRILNFSTYELVLFLTSQLLLYRSLDSLSER